MKDVAIISICKIIFSRLMILHKQCCPMTVIFVCQFVTGSILIQVVPPANIWDVALWIIAIPNVVFYWVMALNAQFLPMNFLFFCVSSLLSPSRYRWFHLVSGGSRWFQLVPRFSMYGLNIIELNIEIINSYLSLKNTTKDKLLVILKKEVSSCAYSVYKEITYYIDHCT